MMGSFRETLRGESVRPSVSHTPAGTVASLFVASCTRCSPVGRAFDSASSLMAAPHLPKKKTKAK